MGDCSKLLSSKVHEITLEYVRRCTEHWAEHRAFGEGSFLKRYKAVDKRLNPPVEFAANRLKCGRQEDQERLNKMTDAEIKKLTAFTHPNIMRLLGYCRTSEMTVLLYEHEQRGSVHKHLLQDDLASKLSWQDRARIVKGLLSAIQHLHTSNPAGPCYHRDVRPGNIVLTESGDAKLIHCGFAQIVQMTTAAADMMTVSEQGMAMAHSGFLRSLGFMSPRYVRTGKFTEKSEVYSIGVTILQTLGT